MGPSVTLPMSRDQGQEQRAVFAALFEAHFDAVLAYARRRTAQLSDAEDVAAETFTIAWRRFGDRPQDEAHHLPWLYGIARRVLANQRRGSARRSRLRERLIGLVQRAPSTGSARLASAVDALPRLRTDDQEILRLVAWEGLSHLEAGVALGITPNAAAIRLHRARRRLANELKGSQPDRTPDRWKGSAKHPAPREDLS